MQPALGRLEFGVDLLDALEDRLACDLLLFLHKPGHGVLERPSSGGCRSDDQSREGVGCSKALCSIFAASLMRRPFGLTDGRGCLGPNFGRMGRDQGWKMCWRMAGKIGGDGLIFEAAAFRDLNSDTEASSKRHGLDVLSKTSRPNSATPPTPNGLSSPIELGPLFLARGGIFYFYAMRNDVGCS
jgi:hypothetical protein